MRCGFMRRNVSKVKAWSAYLVVVAQESLAALSIAMQSVRIAVIPDTNFDAAKLSSYRHPDSQYLLHPLFQGSNSAPDLLPRLDVANSDTGENGGGVQDPSVYTLHFLYPDASN